MFQFPQFFFNEAYTQWQQSIAHFGVRHNDKKKACDTRTNIGPNCENVKKHNLLPWQQDLTEMDSFGHALGHKKVLYRH